MASVGVDELASLFIITAKHHRQPIVIALKRALPAATAGSSGGSRSYHLLPLTLKLQFEQAIPYGASFTRAPKFHVDILDRVDHFRNFNLCGWRKANGRLGGSFRQYRRASPRSRRLTWPIAGLECGANAATCRWPVGVLHSPKRGRADPTATRLPFTTGPYDTFAHASHSSRHCSWAFPSSSLAMRSSSGCATTGGGN